MSRAAKKSIGLLVPVLLAFPAPASPEEPFRRGDVNADGRFDIADPVSLLFQLFRSELAPWCREAANVNGDDRLDIADAIHGLEFLFLGGPAPPEPFPGCGADPGGDGLGCVFFPPCSAEQSEIAAIRAVGPDIEVELRSTRPFPVRALAPVLCMGSQESWVARLPGDGDLHTLIFTLTAGEFALTQDGDPVTLEHGGCDRSLDDQRLYWDLWVFGPLDKGLLGR